MAIELDILLGAILGASGLLAFVAAIGYHRSGVRKLLLTSAALSFSFLFSLGVALIAYLTDWLDSSSSEFLVAAVVVVFGSAIAIGAIGGRSSAGSS